MLNSNRFENISEVSEKSFNLEMATIARIVLGGNSQIEKRDILLKKVVSQLKVVMPGVLYFDV